MVSVLRHYGNRGTSIYLHENGELVLDYLYIPLLDRGVTYTVTESAHIVKCVWRYCIEGNFRMVQTFAVFADRSAVAKIRTARVWIHHRKQLSIGQAKDNIILITTRLIAATMEDRPNSGQAKAWPAAYTLWRSRMRKLKPRKFLLRGWQALPGKFAPAKMSRYTVVNKQRRKLAKKEEEHWGWDLAFTAS